MNNNTIRSIAMWIAIGLIMMTIFNQFSGSSRFENKLVYSQFMAEVKAGNIAKVEIDDNNLTGITADGKRFSTYAPTDPWLVSDLLKNNVVVDAKPKEQQSLLMSIFISWFPMILLVGVWIFFMKQMQGGAKGGGPFSFGKSKARQLDQTNNKTTFADVAGCDESKEEVTEVVDFLKDPAKFHKLGGRIPRGILMVGPPGTGKTLLARAIAGEAKVPFYSISGSDFVEMFVGVGAARVRDMFEQAKKSQPCIIFIDEIDAVGRHRGAGMGGGNDEREQTLNQLLVEMDGFDTNEGVIIIAATNRPDVLDPALLRPGRFDRQVVVSNPDIIGREKILKVHAKKISMSPDVNLRTIARGTPGFSGADLANLVNEAALLAARKNKRIVTSQEFEDAKDKVMMGAERRSMVMTEDEKKLTAYHEGGHAIVSFNLPNYDPIHKATIIPRGRALGMVMNLPERDKHGHSIKYLKARLAVCFGGRVAEELIFGKDNISTGAGGGNGSDINQATQLARAMVTKYGMSEELGPVEYGENQEEVFLGRSVTQTQSVSEAVAQKIDKEIRRLVDEGYNQAKTILTTKIDDLHKIAKALLSYETLTGEDISNIINKNEYPPNKEDLKVEDESSDSALGSIGLKPKIVH